MYVCIISDFEGDVCRRVFSPQAVRLDDVRVGQGPKAIKLPPQAGQSQPPGGEGQVLSYALGHHAEPPVLARENGTERALSDELLVIAGRRRRRRGGGGIISPLDGFFLVSRMILLISRLPSREEGGRNKRKKLAKVVSVPKLLDYFKRSIDVTLPPFLFPLSSTKDFEVPKARMRSFPWHSPSYPRARPQEEY